MSALALVAFAGNLVLCRLALSDGSIDSASFTSIRLVSGALTLLVLLMLASFVKNRRSDGIEVHSASVNDQSS
ncbi:MAG: hypothetical protein ACJA2E_001081 [Arenicella sp.]|jgi:hypothetical protein